MQVQITDAGVALLQSNVGPVVLTLGKFGSGVNYIPDPAATNIEGTLVFQSAPSIPAAVSANLVRYSMYVDVSVATFQFGELGLFTEDGTMFAIAVNSTLITKQAATEDTWGNSLRMDVYLSSVGQNYDMWMDYAESNNQFRMAVVGSPDNLPQPQQAIPNAYVVTGASAFQSAFLAYTDRNGLWNFDAYAFASQVTGTVVGTDSMSVTIAVDQFTDGMNPSYFGRALLEFVTGPLFGTCRYIKTAITSGEEVTLGFQTPMMKLPNVGDQFVVFTRQNDTNEVSIPIATHTQLGGVIVGQSLTVAIDGTLDVDYTKVPFPVKTVAGRTGDVVLTYQDVGGLATVAHTGDYNDLINKPTAYVLPVATASVLGGVKAPPSGNLTISGTGVIDLSFSPVKSVNGQSGIVNLTAADIPGFAPVAISGSYNDLTNKPTIPGPYTLPTASGTVLGGIKVGTGLAIDGSGVLSATAGGIVPATASVLGGVKIGANVTVQGDGTISVAAPYSLPTASGTVLGGVKVGTGLAIDGSGVLSVTATAPVTSVSNQTGAVVVLATDNNSASGTSLIVNSGAATGNIKLKTIVAGTGIALSADGNGNLQIAASATAPVTSVSGQTGAVIIKAQDNNAASGTSLIVADGSGTGIIKLKTIVAGSGVTLAADGNGNLQISSNGGVTSVSSQTGAVIVQASDTSVASGTSLITDAGNTTANIKIRRLVAGAGISLAADGNNNLQITASGGGVTTFNTRSGAVTLLGADITGAGGALATDVAAAKYYDVQGGSAGVLTSSQLVGQHVCVRALTFSANFGGSQGYAGVAGTNPTYTFIVNKIHGGSTTQIGTVVFASGSQTATFTTTGGTAQTTVAGDVVQIVAPVAVDATLANVSITLLSLAT